MGERRISLAIVGAGSRGLDTYAAQAVKARCPVAFTALAEPRAAWRERAVASLGIPPAQVFASWEQLADRPRLADAAIVATPDQLHVEPAVALLRRGYHVLLEKPMATTEAGCRALIAENGGGAISWSGSFPGVLYVRSSVVANNSGIGVNYPRTTLRKLYVSSSLVYGNTTNFTGAAYISFDAGAITNQPALLEADYSLTDGSPCIDSATNLNITVDLRGTPRPQLGGYDMGAFELNKSARLYSSGRRLSKRANDRGACKTSFIGSASAVFRSKYSVEEERT